MSHATWVYVKSIPLHFHNYKQSWIVNIFNKTSHCGKMKCIAIYFLSSFQFTISSHSSCRLGASAESQLLASKASQTMTGRIEQILSHWRTPSTDPDLLWQLHVHEPWASKWYSRIHMGFFFTMPSKTLQAAAAASLHYPTSCHKDVINFIPDSRSRPLLNIRRFNKACIETLSSVGFLLIMYILYIHVHVHV